MITKRTTYIIKVNPEISLLSNTIPSLLNKIEADIKFWEGCLIGGIMSPWNRIENEFFWVTYSAKFKQFIIAWFWSGRVHRIKLSIALESTDLIDDGKYQTEHQRYQKEQYVGHLQTHKSKQRPHHTGTHYNYDDKQLAKLPVADSRREIDRRETVSKTGGVRPHVG